MDLKMHLKMHFLFKCILNAFKNGKFFPKGIFLFKKLKNIQNFTKFT
jgi:hypothetical protein